MPKAKIGDVLEIATSKGLFYAQYTHQSDKMGGVVYIFDTPYQSRPESVCAVVRGSVRFITLLPVAAIVSRRVFEVVGRCPIEKERQAFPVFRSGVPDRVTKRVKTWWFWDGAKEWIVGDITPEQRKMPIRGIWNDTMLILRLEQGWRPETDDE